MLIRHAEIGGAAPIDVRIRAGRLVEVALSLVPKEGESVLEADGGALLPGLHDHHLHLLALAAVEHSVVCGPPAIRNATELVRALGRASRDVSWVRGVGYHESVAGDLDRVRLDSWLKDRPLRIQHRSGALWMLNSTAVDRLGLDRGRDASGVERDADGKATGRLFRLDTWLREQLGPPRPPALGEASQRLARFGVTGVTDATAGNSLDELGWIERAVRGGELRQRVQMMGSPALPRSRCGHVSRGAVKLVLDEGALPGFDELCERIEHAHRLGRPAAIHCVTRSELVLALGAFAEAGVRPGDRLEHAAVAAPELIEWIAKLGLRVVTQPGFLYERGDAYLKEVETRERAWLYRGRGFLEAGVPLAGGTDAPFGSPDPWSAMQAAVDRRSRGGARLSAREALTPEEALALFTSPAARPGDEPRRVVVGGAADLCVLDRSWVRAREALASVRVVACLRDGELLWAEPARLRVRRATLEPVS